MTANEEIRLSVAITVWRREELLPFALQSALCQDRPCAEIVVLSDGTSRAARRFIAPLADRFPIRYCPVERRRKCWGNHLRRRALEETTGSHLVILGHDCRLYPACLRAHAENLDSNPEALSIVPIDYWRGAVPGRRRPLGDDPLRMGEGEVDLLCFAFPRALALRSGCFGEEMVRFRFADYLSFARLRAQIPTVYRPGPTVAAHF